MIIIESNITIMTMISMRFNRLSYIVVIYYPFFKISRHCFGVSWFHAIFPLLDKLSTLVTKFLTHVGVRDDCLDFKLMILSLLILYS